MAVEPSDMTPDDRRYWDAIAAWKAKRLHSTPRELVPASWRAAVSKASGKTREGVGAAAQRIPNAEKFAELLAQALRGLTEAGARAEAASVRTEAVLEGYRKQGFAVEELGDIRKLECKDVQKVKAATLTSPTSPGAEGAGTGFMASGATTLAAVGAVGTGGVAAAPGVGVVVSAMAADAAANVIATNGAVAHIAAYYGYDVDDPAERIYALGVMNMGLAGDAGKLVAYRELNNIVQQLARRQAWKQLNKNGVARVVQAVYNVFGMSIMKKKLAAAVPVVGVAVGAGLNARTLARVVDDAEHLYMERFLREKYGLPLTDEEAPGNDELVEIIDAEIVDEDRADDEQ
ncbi:EcsC family protein [Actinomycetospora cinnamomea]|uniref:EcsC family protein n=1 Tax=Actinomycetospora cinnamomea TaxID=663609 RepID=UPI001058298E|nr:EcsC family protein [Actinomycetospora cinnamomea]